MALAIQDGDSKKARNLLDIIDARTNGLLNSMGPDSTAYLQQLVVRIRANVDIMQTSLNADPSGNTSVQVYQDGLGAIRNAYATTAFPSIAIGWPVTGLGKASLIVRIFGEGGKIIYPTNEQNDNDHPLKFPSNVKLILSVEVRVDERTGTEDRLVLGFTRTGSGAFEQDISASQSTFGPLPLDYDLVPPAFSPLVYTITLTFKGAHCEQLVDTKKIWIQTFDPKASSP